MQPAFTHATKRVTDGLPERLAPDADDNRRPAPLVFDVDRVIKLVIEIESAALPLKDWRKQAQSLCSRWNEAQQAINDAGAGNIDDRLAKRRSAVALKLASGTNIEQEPVPARETVERDFEGIRAVAIEAQGLVAEQAAELVIAIFPPVIGTVEKWVDGKLDEETKLFASCGLPHRSGLREPLTAILEHLHRWLKYAQGPAPHRHDPRSLFGFLTK